MPLLVGNAAHPQRGFNSFLPEPKTRLAADRETFRLDVHAACGNPACSRGWLAFLRDRRRPIFEQRWGCTARCLEAMIDTAIQRESRHRDGQAPGAEAEHRHRIPLGLTLLTHGWITHNQLQRALEQQRHAGRGRIGQWLIDECGLDPACVTRGLSIQWGCPVLPLDGFDPAAMALAVPKLLAEQLGILPLRIAGARSLYLAFADRLDASVAFAMEHMSGLKVQSGLIDETQWKAAQRRLCACDFVDAACEPIANLAALPARMAAEIGTLQPRASRLVRIHQFYWLRMWLEAYAGGVPATREEVADRLYVLAGKR